MVRGSKGEGEKGGGIGIKETSKFWGRTDCLDWWGLLLDVGRRGPNSPKREKCRKGD